MVATGAFAPTEVERLKIDPAIESQARARLAALRAGRDTVKVSELLTRVEAAARSASDDLMPLFVACVENNITVGEICKTLRSVWGEYWPSV